MYVLYLLKLFLYFIFQTLSKPSMLNDRIIKQRVDRYTSLINKEEDEKAEKKKAQKALSRKKKNVVEENEPSGKSESIEELTLA